MKNKDHVRRPHRNRRTHIMTRSPFTSLSLQFILISVASTLPAVAGDLQDQLDARRDAFLERASPEIIQSQKKALADLQKTGITEQALNVGDKAPDFTLGDPDGKQVRLSDILKNGPVVLTWYRGAWCPLLQYRPRFADKAQQRLPKARRHPRRADAGAARHQF